MKIPQDVDRRTVLQTVPVTLVGGSVVSGTMSAARVTPHDTGGSANDLEIVAKHAEKADEHRFELNTREVSTGWTTITFDNQTDHTHFVNAFRVSQAMIDAAAEEDETLRDFFIEHVAGPVQYMTDKKNPHRVADPADLSDKYSNPEKGITPSNLLPPWVGVNLPTGLNGLTSGQLSSSMTLNLKPGDYIIECYVKTEEKVLHSYQGMVDQFAVTDEAGGDGEEPEATIELTLSSVDTDDDETNKGTIDLAEDVRAGQHTVAVHFEDQQWYGAGFHDVHLLRLSETTSIDDVNGWTNFSAYNQLFSDGSEPGTFLGGVHGVVTQELLNGEATETVYFQADLNPGAYAWVSEVPSPADKGLLEGFMVPFEER